MPADAPITVEFDRPVLPQTVRGRFGVDPSMPGCNLDAAFGARPGAAPCWVRWQDGNASFVLEHPGAILAPLKQYTFSLRAGFADPAGVVNTVDHSWVITTGSAPAVRSLNPSDGSTAIPADLPLVVSFTSPMAIGPTAAAISLSPPIPGTRVVRNPRDHSRFLVLPGRPLQPGVTYRLHVSRAATDEHHQALAAPATSTFTAGQLSPVNHAVVLGGRPGGEASQVLIAAMVTAQEGDAIAPETVLAAASCPGPAACGAAPPGTPLETYADAVLSAGGSWLAVVEHDATVPSAPPSLLVLDPATGAVATVIRGGTMPSWSRDGSTLAFADGASMAVYRPGTGAITTLPGGAPPLAPASWGPGSQFAIETGPASAPSVELADADAAARYPVPGLSVSAADAHLSPDGNQLAVLEPSPPTGATWLVPVNGGGGRQLSADLTPLGWADSGTLLGVSAAPGAPPALVLASVTGGVLPVIPAPPADRLSAISVSGDGRLFAYLATSVTGVVQAEVESVQGGSPLPASAFESAGFEAVAVSLN